MMPTKNKGKKYMKDEGVDEAQAAILQAVKDKMAKEQMVQLANLRRIAEEIDTENKALRNELRQVEIDRSDVAAFLRRRLGAKCEEVSELRETNKAISHEKASERKAFLEEIKSREQQFYEMYENHTNEIKALNGRLSNIDEYRDQRDFLLDKNNKLESYLMTMEVRAHAIEKEYEKTNLIDKDRMRREMEEKLLKFSIDFQKATKARIAMATQNVIKENIRINNELSLLIASWQKLYDENESLRTKNTYMENEISVERAMREKLFGKNLAHSEIIDRLAYEHIKIDEFHMETNQLRKIVERLERNNKKKEDEKEWARIESDRIQSEKDELEEQVDILVNQLDGLSSNHERNITLIGKVRNEVDGYFDTEMPRISSSRSDDLLTRQESVFNSLDVMFEEDWLLDVTTNEDKNTSVATVIAQGNYDYGKIVISHERADKESVDTADGLKTI